MDQLTVNYGENFDKNETFNTIDFVKAYPSCLESYWHSACIRLR